MNTRANVNFLFKYPASIIYNANTKTSFTVYYTLLRKNSDSSITHPIAAQVPY
jgi:hypothetical protein